jgi:hypothetical protein
VHLLRDVRGDRVARALPELRRRTRAASAPAGRPVAQASGLDDARVQACGLCSRGSGALSAVSKICLGLLLAALFAGASPVAHADLRAGVGTEFLSWKEDTTPEVKENGGLIAFALEGTQASDGGLLLAYRGRLYAGVVQYEGSELFPPRRPVSSTTEYLGTSQEVQGRYRFLVGDLRPLDLVLGVGVDLWQRKLSAKQKEDFVIGYARLGLESDSDVKGVLVGGGLKYPFYTWENAHLTDIGFTTNPILEPGKQVSPYAFFGYRFESPFALMLYVDTFRFGRSQLEPVTHATQGALSAFQPASTRLNVGFRVVFFFD